MGFSKLVRISPNGSDLVQTCIKGTKQVQMGQIGPNMSKWVQIGQQGSKLVQMGQYRCKQVPIDLHRSKYANKSYMICYGLIWSKMVKILTKNQPNGSGIPRSPGLVSQASHWPSDHTNSLRPPIGQLPNSELLRPHWRGDKGLVLKTTRIYNCHLPLGPS